MSPLILYSCFLEHIYIYHLNPQLYLTCLRIVLLESFASSQGSSFAIPFSSQFQLPNYINVVTTELCHLLCLKITTLLLFHLSPYSQTSLILSNSPSLPQNTPSSKKSKLRCFTFQYGQKIYLFLLVPKSHWHYKLILWHGILHNEKKCFEVDWSS